MNTPLQTDLYQLTMAAAYWQAGNAEQESVFHLFFRKLPFAGGYAVAAGLELALEWLKDFRFSDEELKYLASLQGARGEPLFKQDFLEYLREMELELDIHAVPEGTVMFAHEPLLRVRGPIIQAQLVETALLNIVNFQTLIATKAARVCGAAEGGEVMEFGYRRAQGPDGGLSASRAAFIGGCAATSNVLAGMKYGIPVKGTHAHSWVMAFEDETQAFDKYAEAMPDNSILLVDTYDTLKGIEKAISTGRKLRKKGHELGGIRLDSGDLAWLSQQARTMLDEAGFPNAKIVASNDLDEHLITSLKRQDAKIDIWGVGTNLVTAADQPALGGVYKLAALRNKTGRWQSKIKFSEQRVKSSVPGRQQVRRFFDGGFFAGDAIFRDGKPLGNPVEIVDPLTRLRKKVLKGDFQDLLVPVMVGGKKTLDESLITARERCRSQIAMLHPATRRLENPHIYPAGLERGLWEEREIMLQDGNFEHANPQPEFPAGGAGIYGL